MPRQSRQKEILNVVADTVGNNYRVGRRERYLFLVTITGAAIVTIQGRQKNGTWVVLATSDISCDVNVDNYGWYEVRAAVTAMGMPATATVIWSWR